MWYVLDLNRLWYINVVYDRVRKMQETKAENRVRHKSRYQARIRLLLQTMQKRIRKEVQNRKQCKITFPSQSKEHKENEDRRNSSNRNVRNVQQERQNCKTPLNSEQVQSKRKTRPDRALQQLPWASSQHNRTDFVAPIFRQEVRCLPFGMS